jgi:hypothetical protein
MFQATFAIWPAMSEARQNGLHDFEVVRPCHDLCGFEVLLAPLILSLGITMSPL